MKIDLPPFELRPKENYDAQLILRLTAKQRDSTREIAASHGLSPSEYVRQVLAFHIEAEAQARRRKCP